MEIGFHLQIATAKYRHAQLTLVFEPQITLVGLQELPAETKSSMPHKAAAPPFVPPQKVLDAVFLRSVFGRFMASSLVRRWCAPTATVQASYQTDVSSTLFPFRCLQEFTSTRLRTDRRNHHDPWDKMSQAGSDRSEKPFLSFPFAIQFQPTFPAVA
jgi:hypothetical protein